MTAFLHRYLKKSTPENITYQDFKDFLSQEVEEHQTLEYKPRGILVDQNDAIKRSHNPKDIIGFAELAKCVAGFANAEGGLLILGVKEKVEKYRGEVVKVRPGVIQGLPINITREIIENELLAKIQYPIAGITIVPLRSSSRSKNFIFLIDIPQSMNPPHRVNELYYFQRYNFSTREMKHFQIADAFGKRLAPDLTIMAMLKSGDRQNFTLKFLLQNDGKAVAKYVTCIANLTNNGGYQVNSSWSSQPDDKNRWQFATSINNVIYPDIPLDTGTFNFVLDPNLEAKTLEMQIGIYAEGMVGRTIPLVLDPTSLPAPVIPVETTTNRP